MRQNAVGGGGRYDQLAEGMGGPSTPGIGFGVGLERLLIVAEAEGAVGRVAAGLDAFVVDALGVGRDALVLTQELREAGLRVDRAYGGRSVKAQLKLADRSGAAFGVILGADELSRDAVAVRDLRSSKQVEVPREQLAAWLQAQREFDR